MLSLSRANEPLRRELYLVGDYLREVAKFGIIVDELHFILASTAVTTNT